MARPAGEDADAMETVVALKNRSEALPLQILEKLKNGFERSVGAFVALSLKNKLT